MCLRVAHSRGKDAFVGTCGVLMLALVCALSHSCVPLSWFQDGHDAESDDVDVVAERESVLNSSGAAAASRAIELRHLEKTFYRRGAAPKRAVRGVTLGINYGTVQHKCVSRVWEL